MIKFHDVYPKRPFKNFKFQKLKQYQILLCCRRKRGGSMYERILRYKEQNNVMTTII